LHGVAVHVAKRARTWVQKASQSSPADLERLPALLAEADLDADQRREMIDDVLACLPMKYRAPVVLCDLEGKSRGEAAAALGWPEGTLSGRLCRARKLLANRLARRGVAVPVIGGVAGLLAQPALAVVPAHLAASTIKAAAFLAAGAATAGVVSHSVAAMMRGRGPTMFSRSFKLLVAVPACAGLAFGAFSLFTQQAAGKQRPSPSASLRLQVKSVAEKRAEPAKGWLAKHTFTYKSPVTAVAFGPDFVVTGHQNGDVVLWDAKTGKEKDTVVDGEKRDNRRIDQIQISSDASLLYLVTAERLFVNKCSVAKEKGIFAGLGYGARWFGVNPSGNYYLGTHPEQKALVVIKDPFDENARDQLLHFTHRHSDPIDLVAGVDDNALVTIADGVLRRWKVDNEEQVWEKKLDKIQPTHLVVGAGGKIIAVADKDGEVQLFSAESGKATVKLSGHTGPVRAVAFSRNGKQVVTGGEDKTARVWDAESGKELAKLEGHTNAVTGVAFSPSGEMIVTGCADKTARIWEFNK